ncbi:MAG: hypothetical protein A2161_06490 [Candidatus Schekmanbacteria bacterium RBG_13_48_7]|uniref:Uncharacterized protein n=1 Tax=Candidatus Schekmanbacteria bacterium RBG_13_48_7 TaxID=1817878 RepID=A0A1F7SB77_9BACT|nr:MAG: hypothetical protein A2161_06490 [Candidatus Schekmanbacteria bacterium RBG_13_48_7]
MKKFCSYMVIIVISVLALGLTFEGCKGKKEEPQKEEEDSYKTLATLGLTLFGQRKFNEAAQYWEQALLKEPNNPKNTIICNNLFVIYFQQNKYKECLRVVNIGLAIDPDNLALLDEKGTLLALDKKYDEAIEVLLKAEKSLQESNLKYYFPIGNLADCYRLKKEYEKDEQLLLKYIDKAEKEKGQDEVINSTAAFLYHHLGMLKKDENKLNEAIEAWQKALQINPDQDITHYQLAHAYEEFGDKDKAVDYYKNVLRINPNHVLALNDLGYLYAQKGINLTEAEKMINRAISLDPSLKSITMDSLAWVHYRMKQYDQALIEVDQAIEFAQQLYKSAQENPALTVTPEYAKTLADYYFHKGQIEIALNNLNDAKSAFEESIKFNPDHAEADKALKSIK